jgi:hypothetical protein
VRFADGVALAPDGEVVHDLQAPGGRFGFVTGVRGLHGAVHMGSLTGDTVGLVDL